MLLSPAARVSVAARWEGVFARNHYGNARMCRLVYVDADRWPVLTYTRPNS